jgi:glutaredoxin
MNYYTLITKKDCPFCQKALALLEEKEKQFIYTDMQFCESALEVIKLQANHQTVPMIWQISFPEQMNETSSPLQNNFIGGYEDLIGHLEKK